MRPWLTRGLGMAVLHGAADTALAKAMVYNPTGLLTVKVVVIALLVGAAALWGALDAWLGREDAGRTWVIGAVFAGLASGVLYVIGRGIFVDQSGTEEIWPALTGGAAFTALLVLVPAGLGLFAGGRIARPAEESAGRPAEESAGGSAGDGDPADEAAVSTRASRRHRQDRPARSAGPDRSAPAAAGSGVRAGARSGAGSSARGRGGAASAAGSGAGSAGRSTGDSETRAGAVFPARSGSAASAARSGARRARAAEAGSAQAPAPDPAAETPATTPSPTPRRRPAPRPSAVAKDRPSPTPRSE